MNSTADVAIVGAGVTGLLLAKRLTQAGREVTLLDRGAWLSHGAQLEGGGYTDGGATTVANHERHPDSRPYSWTYVYGVGGSTLAWAGVAPRFEPSDFSLASRFGIARDWPIGYEELEPYYARAERELAVAGEPGAQPPHPFAPVDELIAPYLQPYKPLSQARFTRAVDGRPPCSGLAQCEMCPVDARYSALHTLATAVEGSSSLTLHQRTVAARLRAAGSMVTAIECISDSGEHSTISANTVVVAANGLENAALLLRSGLEGEDVGRWLGDHEHRIVELELDVSARHGYGATPATGVSMAYAGDESRAQRGALLALPVNPGIHATVELVERLAAGERGRELRSRLRERFDRTLVLDLTGEDLPRRDRFLELSPKKDGFGLPLNRVHFPPDSDYAELGFRHAAADLERRLASLGARHVRTTTRSSGAHLLGTCYMGESEGVVDPNLRHHRVENLYVAGGSAFPTYSPSHPTLTIAALALRLGDHLSGAG